MDGKIMCVFHADGFQAVNRGYVFISIQMMKHTSTAIIK